MKNFFFCLICILLYTNISAQMVTKESLIGSYHLPSRSPEGGTEIIIYPNNRFVAVFFGGMINGEWKLKGNKVNFKPDYESDPFILYGRKTTSLKDTTRVIFEKFEDNNSKYINFESNPKDSVLNMQQVFNDDSNCFDYPYILKNVKVIQKLRFTTKQNYWDKATEYNISTFDNSDRNNDFVVVSNHAGDERKEFYATYNNGGLIFNRSDKISAKKDLSELEKEEKKYFEKLANFKIMGEIMYYNKDNFAVDPSTDLKIEYYQYDKVDDRYFNPDLAKIEDSIDFDYSETRNSELLPYRRITNLKMLKQAIKINTKPLFTAKCN